MKWIKILSILIVGVLVAAGFVLITNGNIVKDNINQNNTIEDSKITKSNDLLNSKKNLMKIEGGLIEQKIGKTTVNSSVINSPIIEIEESKEEARIEDEIKSLLKDKFDITNDLKVDSKDTLNQGSRGGKTRSSWDPLKGHKNIIPDDDILVFGNKKYETGFKYDDIKIVEPTNSVLKGWTEVPTSKDYDRASIGYFDDDDDTEIVLLRGSSEYIHVCDPYDPNTGYSSCGYSVGGQECKDVACGDFDGDGLDEIVILGQRQSGQNEKADDIKIVEADNSDTLYDWTNLPNSGRPYESVEGGDFDGDGDDEVVVLDRAVTSKIQIIDPIHDSNNPLDSQVDSDFFTVSGKNTMDIACGDFNLDGIDEIVVLGKESGETSYYYDDVKIIKYDGTVLYGWDELPHNDKNYDAVAAGDLDHDGDAEIIAMYDGSTAADEPRLQIYDPWDPNTGYSNQWFDVDGYGGKDVACGDFNIDGERVGQYTLLQGTEVGDIQCILNCVPQQEGLNLDNGNCLVEYGTSSSTEDSIIFSKITDWVVSASSSSPIKDLIDWKIGFEYEEKFKTTSEYTEKVNLDLTYGTYKKDIVVYNSRVYNIYKYPIVSTTDPNDYLIINAPSIGQVGNDKGPEDFPSYSPFMDHTVGEVVSYTDFNNVPVGVKQIIKGDQPFSLMDDSRKFDCVLTEDKVHNNRWESEITKEISGGIGYFGVNLGLTYTTGEITTQINTITEEVSLGVHVQPDSVLDSVDKQYTIYPFFYWNNGIMVIDFAVKNLGDFYLKPENGEINSPTGGKSYALYDTYDFTTRHIDPEGFDDIGYVEFLINDVSTSQANCFNGIYAQKNVNVDNQDLTANHFYLRNDGDTNWIDAGDKDSMSTVSNSYIYLESGSMASGNDNTLTVTWKVKSKFAWDDDDYNPVGELNLYVRTVDQDDRDTGWEDKGNWEIENDFVVTSTSTNSPRDPGQKLVVEGYVAYEGNADIHPKRHLWHVHLFILGPQDRDVTHDTEEGITNGYFKLDDFTIPIGTPEGDITDGYVRIDNEATMTNDEHRLNIGDVHVNNVAPTVTLTAPNGGEIWKKINTITWTASDNNGDTLTYRLEWSHDWGSWHHIAHGVTTTSYNWDTKSVNDGNKYRIKVYATDGSYEVNDQSDAPFRTYNYPTIVHVDKDYTSSSCGGYIWDFDAFNNLQNGVDAVANGGTVKIYGSTNSYNSLSISKKIKLESQDTSANVVIDGGSSGDTIKITADDVTIKGASTGKGFTIKNSGSSYAGIKLSGTVSDKVTSCTIQDCKIENNYYGIHLYRADDNNDPGIDNNEIYSNTKHGIYLSFSANNIVSTNIIKDNDAHGILISQSSNSNTVINNKIYDNNDNNNGEGDGIYLEYSDGNIIESNRIENTADGGTIYGNQRNGIQLYVSKNNYIQYHETILPDYWFIRYNKQHGIYLHDFSDSNTIQFNRINGNVLDGIHITSNCKENTIDHNCIDSNRNGIYISGTESIGMGTKIQFNGGTGYGIYNNDEDGIYVELEISGTASRLQINDNSIWGNNDYNIHLYQTNDVDILNNYISGAIVEDGIYLEECTDIAIKNNEIVNNNDDGIYLLNSDSNTIGADQAENNIYENKDDGIYLESSDANTIYGNDIYDNWRQTSTPHCDGIYLYDSVGNFIQANEIYNSEDNNQKYGIYLESSGYNHITANNYIHGLVEDGILLYNSDDNFINTNQISDNINGIYILNSDDISLTGNTISDNEYYGILIDTSTSIYLTSNSFMNCGIMIMSPSDPNPDGTSQYYWTSHTIGTTNTIGTSNNPIYYWKSNKNGQTLNGVSAGQVILAGCNDVTIKNINTLNSGSMGILMGYTTNCLIDSNTCNNNNMYGICLWSNNKNIGDPTKMIYNNICNNNGVVGIYLHDNNDDLIVDKNTIDGNANTGYGILLEEENEGNTLKRNLATKNSYGIFLNFWSDSNTLHNNHVILNYEVGIKLAKSCNNFIHNNLIKDNYWYGLHTDSQSDNNAIYYNNFIDNNGVQSNPNNVQAYSDGIGNTWDDGIDTGNYWSDAPPYCPYNLAGLMGYMDNYGAGSKFNDSRS